MITAANIKEVLSDVIKSHLAPRLVGHTVSTGYVEGANPDWDHQEDVRIEQVCLIGDEDLFFLVSRPGIEGEMHIRLSEIL